MVVLSSCTNYDDQFDDLTAQINSLQEQIKGFSELQNALDVVKQTVDALALSLNAQDADFAALQTKLGELETALAAADTSEAVADLQAALDLVKEDITDILENYDVYTGDLLIVDEASLQFALDLGEKVTVISGNVIVKVGEDFGITAAEANVVTSQIVNIVGNLVIEEADAALDFSALKSVTINLHTGADAAGNVSSHAIVEPMLGELFTVGGDVLLNHQTAYAIPSLKRVGGSITMNNVTGTVTGTLTVDFLGLASEIDLHTAGDSAGILDLDSATSVKIAGTPVIGLTAPKALSVELHYADTLASLAINTVSATAVTVMAPKVTNAATITATSGVNAPSLASTGDLTVTAADASFAALTIIGSSASTITAATVSLPVLATVSGTLDLVETTPVSLPALTAANSQITAHDAVSFSAPKLVATAVVSTTVATTVELQSIANANLSAPAVENLKLNSLDNAFTGDAFSTLEDVHVTGKVMTASNSFSITGTALATATFAGQFNAVAITSTASLTTVTTSGDIDSLTVSATTATELALGHSHISGSDGSVLIVVNNTELTSLTTSTDRLNTLTVTGNAKLASLDASSYVTPLDPGAAGLNIIPVITISGNKLSGNYLKAVAATATTPYTEAEITSTDLLTLRDLVVNLSGTATPTLAVDIDVVTINSTTVTDTLSNAMETNATALGSVSEVVNTSTDGIDTTAEFALVKE